MKMSAYALKQQTYHNPSLEASFGNGSTIQQDTFSVASNANKFGSLKPTNKVQGAPLFVEQSQQQGNKENVLSETKSVGKSIKGILKQSSKGVTFGSIGQNAHSASNAQIENSLFYNTTQNAASNYGQQDGVENLLSRVDMLLGQRSKIPVRLESGYQSVTSFQQNYSSSRQVSVSDNTDLKSYLASLESKVLRNKGRDNKELKKSSKLAVQMRKKQQKYIKNKNKLSDSSSSSSSNQKDHDSDSNNSSSSSSEDEQEQIKRKVRPHSQARKTNKEQKQRSFSEARGNNKQNNQIKLKEQHKRQEDFVKVYEGGHFATDLVFCTVCEDYIESGKVDEHSKHCQENQPLLLSKSRRINNHENSEWRYQQERINQKLMKLKIYLEELPVSSNSSQNLRLLIDNLVGTSMRLIQNNTSQPILLQAVSDLISLKAKVIQEETPSNKPIILSTLVLQDKLKHFARKKLDLIDAQQQGLFSPPPPQDHAEDTKTNTDVFSDYHSVQSFRTQKTKSTRIFADIKYPPRQQPPAIQQQQQYQQPQVQKQQQNNYQQQTQLLQQQMIPQQNISSNRQNLFHINQSNQPPLIRDRQPQNRLQQAEDNTKELSIEMKKKLFFEAAVKFKNTYSQNPKVQTLLVSDLYRQFAESGLTSEQTEDFLHSIIQKQ